MINRIDEYLKPEKRYDVQQSELDPQTLTAIQQIYNAEKNKKAPDIGRVLGALETNFPGISTLFDTKLLMNAKISGKEKMEIIESQLYRVSASFMNRGRLMQLDHKMEAVSKVPDLIPNDAEKKYFQEISRQWESNKSNKDRNYFLRAAIVSDEKLEPGATLMLAQNPDYFSVGVLPDHHFNRAVEGGVAAFGKEVRKLLLQDPGPQEQVFPSMSDTLSLIHELTHASQDSKMLERFKPQSAEDVQAARNDIFAEVKSSKTRTLVVLDHEVEAASNEAALFDVLTRRLGQNRTNVLACMQQLSWPQKQINNLHHYIALTEQYRADPRGIVDYTRRRYSSIGVPFFRVSEKGHYEMVK